jgi:DNA-binding NtrC family response regulator
MSTPQSVLEANPSADVILLSASPIEEDHVSLEGVLSHSNWTLCPKTKWMLSRSSTGSASTNELESGIPVIVCDCDVLQDRWKEILTQIASLPKAPLLIVASRLADEHLWVEALNLGAYDVLAKPFDRTEARRILSGAWLHWHHQHAVPAATKQIAMSASGL